MHFEILRIFFAPSVPQRLNSTYYEFIKIGLGNSTRREAESSF
jgi:hypothetical protein